jgi:hypothetical protein
VGVVGGGADAGPVLPDGCRVVDHHRYLCRLTLLPELLQVDGLCHLVFLDGEPGSTGAGLPLQAAHVDELRDLEVLRVLVPRRQRLR